MNRKILLLITVIMFLSLQCSDDKNQLPTSQRLILKNGLLYSDSLSDTPYTGKYFSVYQNKRIEFEVKDGLKEGQFKLFFENGKFEIEGHLLKNKNNGEWKYYYPEGMLQSKGYFSNDTLVGRWYWYAKNGSISESGEFVNGLREGEWQSFDTSGTLQFTRIYQKGAVVESLIQKQK